MNILDFLRGARDLVGEAKKLRSDLDEKKQRRDELRALPLPKEEVIRQVGEYIDTQKDKYQVALKSVLAAFLREIPSRTNDAIATHGGIRFLTHATGPGELSDHHRNIEPALIAILGDTLKGGIIAEIERMDWPKCGPVLKDRERLIEALDSEIASLEKTATEIDAKINEAQQALR